MTTLSECFFNLNILKLLLKFVCLMLPHFNLLTVRKLNLSLSPSLSLSLCRTIPHLCGRLKLRNWNSAIARSIHTIRRNLVSIKMQISHFLAVNCWRRVLCRSCFGLLGTLLVMQMGTHCVLIGRRMWSTFPRATLLPYCALSRIKNS